MPPPSWAKSATNDAPNPKPTIRNGIFSAHAAGSVPAGANCASMAYNPPTPSRLMATVKKPDTAPPLSAVCSAALSDSLAAAATRILARMEIHMPMKPATAEQIAPRRNDTVTKKASAFGSLTGSVGVACRITPYPMASTEATSTASTPIVLYWRARYASAPSWMALEMARMASVPVPRASTQRANQTAKMSAKTDAPRMMPRREDCVGPMSRSAWGGRR